MIEIPAELLEAAIQCIATAQHPSYPWQTINDLLQNLAALRPAEPLPEPEPNHHEAPVG